VVSSEKFAKIYHEENLHVYYLWKVGQKQLRSSTQQFHVLPWKVAKDLFSMCETMAAYNNNAF